MTTSPATLIDTTFNEDAAELTDYQPTLPVLLLDMPEDNWLNTIDHPVDRVFGWAAPILSGKSAILRYSTDILVKTLPSNSEIATSFVDIMSLIHRVTVQSFGTHPDLTDDERRHFVESQIADDDAMSSDEMGPVNAAALDEIVQMFALYRMELADEAGHMSGPMP